MKKELQAVNTVQGQMEPTPRSLHTPGPWAYELVQTSDPAYKYAVMRNGRGWWLTLVTGGQDNSKGEGEANARLIAAAPELYEAAKMFEDLMTTWPDEFRMEAKCIAATMTAGSMIEKFRNAIAKVEGRKAPSDGALPESANAPGFLAESE